MSGGTLDRPANNPGDWIAGVALAAPIACLCWRRGGVDAADYTPVFGAILALTAVLCLSGRRLGVKVAIPWPAAVIALLPFLQLIPLGQARALLWLPWRQDLSRVFAELGIETPSAVSLYPYATLGAALLPAGYCALFVLARSLARCRRRTVIVVTGALVAIASAEAFAGLHAVFSGSRPVGQAGFEVFAAARGTFVNRNDFAVLLEAGFCLALGLLAAARSRGIAQSASVPPRLMSAACWLAAALCAAAIAASRSRMGLLVTAAAALAAGLAFVPGKKRRFLVLASVVALSAVTIVLTVPLVTEGFENLLRDGGDPGRMAIWSDSWSAAQRHLLTGSGLGTFPLAFQRSHSYFPQNLVDHAHCDWLEILVEAGLPGSLFLLASIGAVVIGCARPRQPGSGALDRLRVACLLGAAAILLHAGVDFPLKIPALAALLSVLLGCAHGLARRDRSAGPPKLAARGLSALGCALLAALAVLLSFGGARSWRAEALYEQGQNELLTGRPGEAETHFRASLAANPYDALVWQKRAETAAIVGDERKAREFLELASRLEPHTFRIGWPLAQALLRQQQWPQAAERLREFAEVLPQFRPVFFQTALQAGMPAALITATIVPHDAAGVWWRLLADRKAWAELDHAVSRHAPSTQGAVAPSDLRYVFDRLFQHGQQQRMTALWDTVSLTQGNVPASSTLPGDESCRGCLGGDGHSAGCLSFTPVRLDDGFGFQWVSEPSSRTLPRLHEQPFTAPYLELDFRAGPRSEFVSLSRYFETAEPAAYVLEAEAKVEKLRGGGIRLEIWSPHGLVASSGAVRRSLPWRTIEIPFRTEVPGQVLQFRVAGGYSGSIEEIHGRFMLRGVRLRPRMAKASVAIEQDDCSEGRFGPDS